MEERKKLTLTKRQKEVYEFLKDKIMNRGYGPTVREIGSQFGIRSPNGVMSHLKALEKKGYITRESHMSRAIQLTESPSMRMSLRLSGQIAAGSPLIPEEQDERVDFGPLFDTEGHFTLKVNGDFMAEGQVADGDHLIVRRQDTAKSGDEVVLSNGDGNTKVGVISGQPRGRKFKETGSGKNPALLGDHEIHGVVVGVIRQY